jgi:hypothetical protein
VLAAAASVVLFLNISRQAPTPVLHQQPETTVLRRAERTAPAGGSMGAAADRADAPQQMATSRKRAAEAPAAVMKSTLPMPAVEPAEPAVMVEDSMEIPDTEPAPRSDSIQDAAVIAVAPAQADFDGWLQSVQQGCRSKKTGESFWAARIREAETGLQARSPADRQFLGRLLPLLQQLRQDPARFDAICKQVQQRIKARESR